VRLDVPTVVHLDFTASDLADVFAKMAPHEQATFLEKIAATYAGTKRIVTEDIANHFTADLRKQAKAALALHNMLRAFR
jgi:predicted HAD superfamily phosphohydrolase